MKANRAGLVIRFGAMALAAASLSACVSVKLDPFGGGGGKSSKAETYARGALRAYKIDGKTYKPEVVKHYDEKGLASWYGYPAGTRQTADGEWFDGRRMAAAHKTLPLPCVVEVTNLENGRRIKVRVNDRGPFVKGRIIDLTRAAADQLGFTRSGTAHVRVKFLGPAPVADSGEILMAEVDASRLGAPLADGEAQLY